MQAKSKVNPSVTVTPNIFQQLSSLQRILSQQPTVESLVNIGGSTVLAGSGSTNQVSSHLSNPSNPTFSYKVKIINPVKKSDVSVRHLNDCNAKFDSVVALRVKLIEAFQDSVPNTMDFNLGYYQGSQQAKIWLVTPDDLKSMYQKYPNGSTITLWCDARCEESENCRKRKRDTETGKKHPGTIEENECEVDRVYKKLLDQHGSNWDTPRLRLWARCICTSMHQSYDDPPDIPAFKGPEPKKRKESITEALTGAAVAFAQVVSGNTNKSQVPTVTEGSCLQATRSPRKAVELRMKNYEQLRYVQELYNDGILDEKEFNEQKKKILEFIKNM